MVESTALFDGIQFLIQDHNLLKQLFSKWKDSSTSQNEKNSIVEHFIREICMHASAEERYLYPLIAEKIKGGKLLSERNYLDDQLNKQMLQFLLDHVHTQKSDMDKYVFNKAVEKFIQIELEHLQQEEDDVFPRLRSVLTSQELVNLHNDLQTAKNNAPTHPHPNAPMKFGSKILHPLAGAIDKLLDYGNKATGTTISDTTTSQQKEQGTSISGDVFDTTTKSDIGGVNTKKDVHDWSTIDSSTKAGSQIDSSTFLPPEEKPLLSEAYVPGSSGIVDEKGMSSGSSGGGVLSGSGMGGIVENFSSIPIERSDQTTTTQFI